MKYTGFAFTAEFEARLAISSRYNAEKYLDKPQSLHGKMVQRLLHNHVSQRLEYSFTDARYHGIEYAYPLLDVELVELYDSLPSAFKFHDGMGRALARDAMKGVLPEKIRLRNDKTGSTIPTFQQRVLQDYEVIRHFIRESGDHNRYHYLDTQKMLEWLERIKRLGDNRVPANPGAFLNSLQILLLQEMERTGEFRSAIRC